LELFLLRHGIPVEPELWSGTEIERPLTDFGREQTVAVLEALVASGRVPGRGQPGAVTEIWSSPLARCSESARLASLVLAAPVRPSPWLAVGAHLPSALPRGFGDPARWPESVLCVGHMPDLGLLIEWLAGGRSGPTGLGRAGTARLSGRFAGGGMKLRWLRSAEEALARGTSR
jgi:phosphohistidine phosphatase